MEIVELAPQSFCCASVPSAAYMVGRQAAALRERHQRLAPDDRLLACGIAPSIACHILEYVARTADTAVGNSGGRKTRLSLTKLVLEDETWSDFMQGIGDVEALQKMPLNNSLIRSNVSVTNLMSFCFK